MAVLDLGKVVPEKGVDYFTESDVNQIVDDVVDEITIPTKVSELENDSEFIDKTANNLTYYTLATNTGSTIELSINSSTYVMTMNLKNAAGTVISTGSVDLPLESVVVNGSYDSVNKKIVLTLQGGSTIDVPVGDLINGLQSEITSSNKLSSDLVDDTNQANKFVTTSEKTTWNAKYDKPSTGIPSSDLSSSVQTSLGKADTAIQDVSDKQDTLVSGTNIKTINNESILGAGNLEISGGKSYIIPYYNYTDSAVVSNIDEVYQAYLLGNIIPVWAQIYSGGKLVNIPLSIKEGTATTIYLVSRHYIDFDSGGVNYDRGYIVKFQLTINNGHISAIHSRVINSVDVSSSDGKILKHNNNYVYTPTNDYNPATKKYVDDAIAGGGGTPLSCSYIVANELGQKHVIIFIGLGTSALSYSTHQAIKSYINEVLNDSNINGNSNIILSIQFVNAWFYTLDNFDLSTDGNKSPRYQVGTETNLMAGTSGFSITRTNGVITNNSWSNTIFNNLPLRYLGTSNTTAYTPSNDYNPATKKYVDDAIAGGGGGGQTIQYETMPTPSASNEGDVIQFVGTTTSDYINGYYYQCVSDGQATPTYSWLRHDTQPSKYIIDDNSVTYFVRSGQYNINTNSTTSQTGVSLPFAEVKEAIKLAQKYNKRLTLHIIDYGDFNSIDFIGSAVPPTSGTTYEMLGKTISSDGNVWLTKLNITYTYSSNEVTISNIKRVGHSLKTIGTTNSYAFEPNYDSYAAATAKYAESMTLPIAPRYARNTPYAVGDYVTQYNKLYVCNTAIPSGENWNASHWTETNVVSIIGNLETALSNITTGNGV